MQRMEREKEKLLVGKSINLMSSSNEDKRRLRKLEERIEESEEIAKIKKALVKNTQKEEIRKEEIKKEERKKWEQKNLPK